MLALLGGSVSVHDSGQPCCHQSLETNCIDDIANQERRNQKKSNSCYFSRRGETEFDLVVSFRRYPPTLSLTFLFLE
jgi:hypothetical protein